MRETQGAHKGAIYKIVEGVPLGPREGLRKGHVAAERGEGRTVFFLFALCRVPKALAATHS